MFKYFITRSGKFQTGNLINNIGKYKNFTTYKSNLQAKMEQPKSNHQLSTVSCIIIGDEILNGKIHDKNSNYLAKYCFALGLKLVRIETVPDEYDDIIDAIKRCYSKSDMVVTSGGIGPTHDDITYEAIAKAFDLKLEIHKETQEKMKLLSQYYPDPVKDKERYEAKMRMAALPCSNDTYNVDYIYVDPKLWVPIVVIGYKVHILPGIPQLFQSLLEGIRNDLKLKINPKNKSLRYLISTSEPESMIAPYLSSLQKTYSKQGFKIGSYPHMKTGNNTVSLIGSEDDKDLLEAVVREIEATVVGTQISEAQEALES